MKNLLVFLLTIILIFSVCSCSSSRKIPISEIPTFKDVISLYEAKYKYGLNGWWEKVEQNNSRVQQFNIVTNPYLAESTLNEFFNVSKVFCESKSGVFTSYENVYSWHYVDAGRSSLNEYPIDKILSARMKFSQGPSFSCKKTNTDLFYGYVAARLYTVRNSGQRGCDMIIWVSEIK